MSWDIANALARKCSSGAIKEPEHCECTRQSILYILDRLEPASVFEVEILETVLRVMGIAGSE